MPKRQTAPQIGRQGGDLNAKFKAVVGNGPQAALYRVLVRHLINGLDAPAAAREMDLPPDHVQKMLLKPEFEAVFTEVDPKGFQIWKNHKLSVEADQDVQVLAKQNAVRNYVALQELADTAELKPHEKKDVLQALLKIAGALKDDQPPVEVVKITPTHMAALAAAAREVDARN